MARMGPNRATSEGMAGGLSGWGRTYVPGRELRSEDLAGAAERAHLSRGLGRSYGDASLPAPGDSTVLGTCLADRLLAFDAETGLLRAEAGLCLAELNRLFLPRGWFTPVTPGTKFVTLGGMVASDVHGKNHHVAGTFGKHVRSLRIRVGDGRVVDCSRQVEPELFLATLGGMGLTGHVLEVEVQLERIPSPWILQQRERLPNLDAFLTRLREAGREWPYTVGWVDTLATGKAFGRGILYAGRWAEPSEAPASVPPARPNLRMPIALPSGVLNTLTIRMFNSLLYRKTSARTKVSIVDPQQLFYPLDRVLDWNRMYGSRGVAQHQAVIPNEAGADGIRALMDTVREAGSGSFLTVVKDCGEEGEGMLSFPRPGMSIAFDLPIRDNTQDIIDRLNERVIEAGGRVYLTKDGHTRPEHFRAMEDGRLDAFLSVKRKWDPEGRLRSAQSARLFGDDT